MSGHVQVSQMLPGVHRVGKKLARGRVAEYWYAWRGGPQILAAVAANPAALERAVAGLTAKATEDYNKAHATGADDITFYGLVTRYLEALEKDTTIGDRTKSDRRKYLDVARADLGQMELMAFESRKARPFLINWRDTYAHIPKTADARLEAVSAVLNWAVDRGEVAANPVKEFPRIYKADRADVIWEPHQLAALLQHAAPEFEHAVRFAALSALREADLIRVPWSAVGPEAIIWQTGKSRGRRTVVIPLTAPLRALLDEIPRRDATTILTSARKLPWKASGLAAALRRCRIDEQKRVAKQLGVKFNPKKPPETIIDGLRFHDLRGTAATNFLLAGLELSQVALILGWKLDRVREIAARYVSGQAMGLAMVKQLGRRAPKAARKNAAGTKAVNRAVNRGSAA